MGADLTAYGRQYLRSSSALFFTLAFPVLLLLVFGGIFGNPAGGEVTLHVQDGDGTPTSRALVEALEGKEALAVQPVPDGVDLGTYVGEEGAPAALRIPAGFEAGLQRAVAGEDAAPVLVLYGDPSSAAFQRARDAVRGAVAHLTLDLAGGAPVVVDTEPVARGDVDYVAFFLPGVIGITVLTPLFATAYVSAQYRERHYFKLLATTPLRKGEWLLARTLWLFLLILASTLLLILVARLAFGTALLLTPSAAALILAGTVLFTSLGMAVGTFLRDPETANAVANALYFPMFLLSGTFWPIEAMPGVVQPAARLLPLTFVNDGLRDTLLFANEAGALVNLAVTAGLAVALFLLAARTMRWREE